MEVGFESSYPCYSEFSPAPDTVCRLGVTLIWTLVPAEDGSEALPFYLDPALVDGPRAIKGYYYCLHTSLTLCVTPPPEMEPTAFYLEGAAG